MNNYKKGYKGEDLKQYQEKLGITSDGVFGPQTDKAVREFQKKNNLTVDGIIGKNTIQAFNKTNNTNTQPDTKTTDTGSNTANESTFNFPTSSKEIYEQRYKDALNTTSKEDLVKQATERFQGEIDETRNLYDSLIKKETEKGEARLERGLGMDRALRANRGILGTARGQAEESRVRTGIEEQNQQNLDLLNTKKLLALNNLRRQVRDFVDLRQKEEKQAKEKGIDSYLEYLTNKETKDKENANLMIDSWVKQGVPLEKLSNDDVIEMAEAFDMTPEQIKTIYLGKRRQQEIIERQQDLQRQIQQANLAQARARTASIYQSMKLAREKQAQDLLLKKLENSEISDKEKQAYMSKYKKARGGILNLQETKALIDDIYNHSALSSAVGPNMFGRMTIYDALSGNQADFIGSVDTLIEKKFIDELINSKDMGATYGQLTEQEGRAIRQAATKLASWRMVDDKGNTIGFDIDEDNFKKELNRLKTHIDKIMDYKKQDLVESSLQSGIIDKQELSELDNIFNN